MTTSTPLPAADPSAPSTSPGSAGSASGDSKSALAAYWANSDTSAPAAGDAANPAAAAPSFDQWLQAGPSGPTATVRGSMPDSSRARAKPNLAPNRPNGAAPLASAAASVAADSPTLTAKNAPLSSAALKHLAAQTSSGPETAATAFPAVPPPVAPVVPAAGLPTLNPGLPGTVPTDGAQDSDATSSLAVAGYGGKKRPLGSGAPSVPTASAAGASASNNGAKLSDSAANSANPRVADRVAPAAADATAADAGSPASGLAGGPPPDPISSDLVRGRLRGETPGTAASSGTEKIAANPAAPGSGESGGNPPRDKNSLTSNNKEDADQVAPVGMPGAKSETTMSAPAFAHPHFVQLDSSFGVAAPSTTGDRLAASTPNAAAVSTAREAVNTVIKMADAQAAQAANGVHSVSIGIKFGDTTLGVRVEMRGSEVHTQFNTDSPELQAALAGEWGNLTKDNTDRSYQFSDPVFASANGNSADLSSGTGGGAAGQDRAPQFSSARSAFAASTPVSAAASDASAPAPTAASVLTARHLSTFA